MSVALQVGAKVKVYKTQYADGEPRIGTIRMVYYKSYAGKTGKRWGHTLTYKIQFQDGMEDIQPKWRLVKRVK